MAAKTLEEVLERCKAEIEHKKTHKENETDCEGCYLYYTCITNELFIDLIERVLKLEKH